MYLLRLTKSFFQVWYAKFYPVVQQDQHESMKRAIEKAWSAADSRQLTVSDDGSWQKTRIR